MKRELELLKRLLQADDFITIEELSDAFSVSERTIRDDLVLVEECIVNTNLKLVRHRTRGVFLNRKKVNGDELIGLLKKITESSLYKQFILLYYSFER